MHKARAFLVCAGIFFLMLLCLWVAPLGAQPVPVRSQVGLQAWVNFFDVGIQDSDTQVDSQSDPLASLGVTVSAHAECSGAWATASGHVEASWVSASAGAVHVEAGFDKNANAPQIDIRVRGAAIPVHEGVGIPDWVYSFVADTNGAFRLSYSCNDDSPGYFYVVFNSSCGEQRLEICGGATGSTSFAFADGDICTVRLINSPVNYSGSGGDCSVWQGVSCSWDFDVAPGGPTSTAQPTWGQVKVKYATPAPGKVTR